MARTVKPQRLLIFGSTGTVGGAICEHFSGEGWEIVAVVRVPHLSKPSLIWNPLDARDADGITRISAAGPFDAVCWAQGANCSDSIYEFDLEVHKNIYEVNVLFIIQSLNILVSRKLLARPARLCIVSSIWQNLSKQGKLSYGVSKAALQGLVLSAANDLGRDGHLVNAILPGVIDSPMTRANLAHGQIESVMASTQFRRLPSLEDVSNAVYALCDRRNTGITGQFICVDLGFSNVRII